MNALLKNIVVFVITLEARLAIQRHKPMIIAVTGSVGKTSTKDAIFHVLSSRISIRKSEKSFNSEIGVPLTILGLSNAWHDPLGWIKNIFQGFMVIFKDSYPRQLVLEIGADHPGDIARLTTWLHPDIALVTRIPERPVHVEFFDSPEEVKKEKGELVRAINKGGVFVANADDERVMSMKELTSARVLTYGTSPYAEVRGSEIEVTYETTGGRKIPTGMHFFVDYNGEHFPITLTGVLGCQPVFAVLGALAAGIAEGETLQTMIATLSTIETPPGRMRIISGVNGSTIIDDSYNSSPVALGAALETLKNIEANHRIALLGDMLELGEWSDEEHWKAGRDAGGFVDLLFTVGERGKLVAAAAKTAGLPAGKIESFTDAQKAGLALRERLQPGDVVLVKGSQGSGENMIRMERAVKEIMLWPEKAPELLVRQEVEWQRQYTPR